MSFVLSLSNKRTQVLVTGFVRSLDLPFLVPTDILNLVIQFNHSASYASEFDLEKMNLENVEITQDLEHGFITAVVMRGTNVCALKEPIRRGEYAVLDFTYARSGYDRGCGLRGCYFTGVMPLHIKESNGKLNQLVYHGAEYEAYGMDDTENGAYFGDNTEVSSLPDFYKPRVGCDIRIRMCIDFTRFDLPLLMIYWPHPDEYHWETVPLLTKEEESLLRTEKRSDGKKVRGIERKATVEKDQTIKKSSLSGEAKYKYESLNNEGALCVWKLDATVEAWVPLFLPYNDSASVTVSYPLLAQ